MRDVEGDAPAFDQSRCPPDRDRGAWARSVMINTHLVDPKLHRAVEQMPRTGQLANIEALGRDLYALGRGYLDAHGDEMMSPIQMSPLHLGDRSGDADACGSSASPGHPHRRQSTKVCGRRNSVGYLRKR